jgi:D-sedoheptulose 7-phosphate isomerase
MKSIIKNEFNEHNKVSMDTIDFVIDTIEDAAKICINSLKQGGKILIIGNGGSAADAQHIAAELVGRYKNERKGLSAIALTTDTSAITSIANDFGYNNVFERQVEALARSGDVLIGISTGGTSSNIISAIELANNLGCNTIGFSGRDGGKFNEVCKVNIIVKSDTTARIQEMHILIGHIICQIIDLEFSYVNKIE